MRKNATSNLGGEGKNFKKMNKRGAMPSIFSRPFDESFNQEKLIGTARKAVGMNGIVRRVGEGKKTTQRPK